MLRERVPTGERTGWWTHKWQLHCTYISTAYAAVMIIMTGPKSHKPTGSLQALPPPLLHLLPHAINGWQWPKTPVRNAIAWGFGPTQPKGLVLTALLLAAKCGVAHSGVLKTPVLVGELSVSFPPVTIDGGKCSRVPQTLYSWNRGNELRFPQFSWLFFPVRMVVPLNSAAVHPYVYVNYSPNSTRSVHALLSTAVRTCRHARHALLKHDCIYEYLTGREQYVLAFASE